MSVGWRAECRAGERVFTGRIYDISPDGGFFGIDDGNASSSDDLGLGYLIVGQTVTLSFPLQKEDTPSELEVVIKWVGESKAHNCYGVGFTL